MAFSEKIEVPGGAPEALYERRQCVAPAVAIVTLAPQRVIFVHHVGPYAAIEPVWHRLCGWAGSRGLLSPSTRFLGISYDDPDLTPAGMLCYDAALSVDVRVEPTQEIGVMELPGGDYAFLPHYGPYELLAGAYRWFIGTWLPSSGRKMRNSPCFEVYLNTPDRTPPEDLLTHVYLPLEPATESIEVNAECRTPGPRKTGSS